MAVIGGGCRSPLIGTVEFPAMIEQLAFAALTKAWVTTMIATGLLFLALATAQVWNSTIYFQGLPQAMAIGDGPAPIIDRFDSK
jgi:hypothetical protein